MKYLVKLSTNTLYLPELVMECTTHNIAFPALETLEDRFLFPKRHFLFYDKFVRAGRHNQKLWKKIIAENKGNNRRRFGPTIFEAHIKTIVRENYFLWIFQLLCDKSLLSDEEVDDFCMEYDDTFLLLPNPNLVCTSKHTTKFPFEKCELVYGELPVDTNPDDPTAEEEQPRSGFKIIMKTKRKNDAFVKARERQRERIITTARENAGKYSKILSSFRSDVKEVRQNEPLHRPENKQMLKTALSAYKKRFRLLEDPEEQDDGNILPTPSKRLKTKSAKNKTRYSDVKLKYLYDTNEEMKQMELDGTRRMWEEAYKCIWNEHINEKKEEQEVVDILPETSNMTRDLEEDVKQLMADCCGEIEEL